MAARTNTTVRRFEKTFESVDVNACWAPRTSPLSRWTSAPVRVRLKKASGMRCTWSKTAVRRSTMRPSPMREENHRWATPSAPESTASPAATAESATTTPTSPAVMPSSMMRWNSSGVAAPAAASTEMSTRNAASWRR